MRYIFPLRSYITITQPFKGVKTHSGIDFGWNSKYPNADGQQIVAAEDGTVVKAVDGYGNTWGKLPKIYGNYVIIDHGDKEYTVYGHLAKGLSVKRGQKVKKGDVLGRMGNSGYSKGQHLHFELRKGANNHDRAVNALPYLRIEDRSIIVSPNTMLPDDIKYRVITTPVAENPKVDQIEVTGRYVNARADHSTTAESYGYTNVGFYNVIDTVTDKKYTWYNTGDFWIANVSGVRFIPKAQDKFNVTFFSVSEKDLTSLEAVAKQLGCKYKIEAV